MLTFSLIKLKGGENIRKIEILLLISTLMLFMIASVSAEDISADESVAINDSDDGIVMTSTEDIINQESEPSNELNELEVGTLDELNDPEVGTFDELNRLITSSSGSITLSKDYKKTSDDSVGAEGIVIRRGSSITEIDGDGHTLDASEMGRILTFDGGQKVILKNIKFINAKYDGNGGALLVDNRGVELQNCTFINNVANDGGAIYSEAAEFLVNNSHFKNNTAETSGGAIHIDLYGFKIYNSDFEDNKANYAPTEYSSFSRYGGGAIYAKFYAIHGFIENCTFNNNSASYLGGAINVQSGANSQDTTTITNCTFTNNEAASDGAVFLGTRLSTIDNSRFINNHANETAGAVGVYNYYNSITNSYFENNSAERDGGAVFSFAPYYHINTIDNSTFINNKAGTYGGAVNAISTDITGSKFINNTAGDYAGAVTAYGSDVTNSEFKNNNAPDGTVLVMNDGSDINGASSRQSNNGLSDDEVSTDYTDRGILSPMLGYPPNVIWSDLGFVGFCCEKFFSQPYSGVVDHSLNTITNNINGEVVSEYLKILLFTYFDGYNDFNRYSFPDYVWEFTDYDYKNSELEVVQHVIELYDSGFRVPTENALKVLDDGTILRMDFLALDTADGEQDIFLFNWDTVNGNIVKESMNMTTFIGEKIDFKITVKNTGDAKLSNITVEDNDFSSELIYVGPRIESGNWTYDSKEKVWRLDNLDSGKSAVLILTFKSTTNGTFYNNATLKTKDYLLKEVTASTNVYTPQLFTKKVSLNKTVFNGQIAEFVITLNNTGDYPLSGVFVDDIADEGLVYVTYVNGSRDWNYKDGKFYLIGKLDPNEVANLTVLFKTTKSGNFTNTATGGSDETENHTWEDTVEVFSPQMTVKKITLNESVSVGEIVKFKIIVNNTGDYDLTGVKIEEKAPEGLTYAGYESDLEDLSYNDGIFSYSKLSVGESIEFIVLFKTTEAGTFINSVDASSNETEVQNASNTTVVNETAENETDNSTDTNETDDTEEEPSEDIPDDSTDSDKVPSTDETDEKSEVNQNVTYKESKSVSKQVNVDSNATGNPILVLLLIIAVLISTPIRRK